MIKVGSLYRNKMIATLLESKETAEAMFFVGFSELSAIQLTAFRKQLHKADSGMFVTKNSLIQRSFEGLDLSETLKGQTGVINAAGDIVEVAKIISEFSKENKALVIKGGVLGETAMSADDVKALAELPSRDVLIAMAVNAIASPLISTVTVMKNVITKLPWALNAIADKKEN